MDRQEYLDRVLAGEVVYEDIAFWSQCAKEFLDFAAEVSEIFYDIVMRGGHNAQDSEGG